jgi:drug/metabolite transporter (DMT)-like permease
MSKTNTAVTPAGQFSFDALKRRFRSAPPTTRAILWAITAGITFSVMNMLLRLITQQVHTSQGQFLRHFFGLAAMLPLVLRSGIASYRPKSISGQFTRGIVHTIGVSLWFFALPHLALADMTAIGYTGPIFSMMGAAYLLGEKMRADRWLAAIIGFIGVLIVVGPRLAGGGGWYTLIMLASAPVFSLSFLLTKMLTRHDSPQLIVVWQTLTVSILTLPFALYYWTPMSVSQWLLFAFLGMLGSAAHFCMTHSLKAADMSATQPVKFLDLLWASMWGIVIFGDQPTSTTLLGGVVIVAATLWIARRESKVAKVAQEQTST